MNLPKVQEAWVKGKRVLLRLDLDVPVQDGKVVDDSRLQAGLLTVRYLLEHGARVFIVGHLGRPHGADEKYSLFPVVQWLAERFKIYDLRFKKEDSEGLDGWKLNDNLFVLENLRFYKGEEENSPEFAQKLASLADIYVNDAFAVSHRDHASITGVAKRLPHYAGLQLQKEVEVLSNILQSPKRPLVVIVGGAKIETKLPLIEKMHQFADYVLVGGKIAEETRTLLKVQHEKVQNRTSILLIADLNDDHTDITEVSCENFVQIIQKEAKTIVWNGTMGKINPELGKTTVEIAKAIVQSGVYSLVGGGDTVGFLGQKNLLKDFSFVSTGGGAMLVFLAGEKLPGLLALE